MRIGEKMVRLTVKGLNEKYKGLFKVEKTGNAKAPYRITYIPKNLEAKGIITDLKTAEWLMDEERLIHLFEPSRAEERETERKRMEDHSRRVAEERNIWKGWR